MLMLPGEIHHLGDLRFCDFISVDTAFADPMVMDMQHDARRFLDRFVEIFAENDHNEFLGRVIIVE